LSCQFSSESLASEKIPLFISKEDALDSEENWHDKYSDYASLYEYKEDKQDDKYEDVDLSIDVIAEVDIIPEKVLFGYEYKNTNFWSSGSGVITQDDVNYKIIDKIIFPKPLLQSRPCFLTSKQTYAIVRQYVKQHINLEVAKITSDYDFCFTVKKIIPLSEPEKVTVDVNFGHNLFSKRKRKPKYKTQLKSKRSVEIFEMTHDEQNYEGYTPIKGFKAENTELLKQYIDEYCQELIKFINEPFIDCPHCKGLGVVKPEVFSLAHEHQN
jgi:hypothetical protein